MAQNILVKKYKLNVENKEYTFVLNLGAALKCEEKYGDFASIYNGIIKGLLGGKDYYTNIFKMLSCACEEKDWDYKELAGKFSINVLEIKKLDKIVFDMYEGFELFDKKGKTTDGKNETASQDTK